MQYNIPGGEAPALSPQAELTESADDWSIPKVRLRADVDDSKVVSSVDHLWGIQGLWKN